MKLRISLLTLLLAIGMSHAQNWTTWRGPASTGVLENVAWNPDKLQGEPSVLWEAQIGLGYSAVAVMGRRLYALGNNGLEDGGKDRIVCLDVSDGREIWSYEYECVTDEQWPGPSASPIVDDNRLYTLCDDTGTLFCLNAETGTLIWKRDLASDHKSEPPYEGVGYSGTPVVHGDLLILNMNQHGIAVDKLSGKTEWASPSGACSFSTPVLFDLDGTARVALFGAHYCFIIDPRNGEVLQRYPWETNCNENSADPIVFDGKVFLSSAYRVGAGLIDISGSEPRLVWKNMNMSNLFSSSVLIDGLIYGFDGNTRRCGLACIEAASGKLQWRESMAFGSLIAINDQLLLTLEDGTFVVADATASGYQESVRGALVRTPAPGQPTGCIKKTMWWTGPVISDGRLFVRSDKGHLLCLDVAR